MKRVRSHREWFSPAMPTMPVTNWTTQLMRLAGVSEAMGSISASSSRLFGAKVRQGAPRHAWVWCPWQTKMSVRK